MISDEIVQLRFMVFRNCIHRNNIIYFKIRNQKRNTSLLAKIIKTNFNVKINPKINGNFGLTLLKYFGYTR